jgi:hypothetical protein
LGNQSCNAEHDKGEPNQPTNELHESLQKNKGRRAGSKGEFLIAKLKRSGEEKSSAP